MKRSLSLAGLTLLLPLLAHGQIEPSVDITNNVPASASPAGGGGQSSGSSNSNNSPRLSLPSFDPGSEILSFDGKLWNINNNRAFRARFEKYLAAPESPAAEDAAYRKILDEIRAAISPNRSGGPDLARAVALLPLASQSSIDANLCESLASAIYTVWISKKSADALSKADAANQKAISDLHRNIDLTVQTIVAGGAEASKGTGGSPAKSTGGAAVTDYTRRIAELEALRAAAAARRELTELEAKLQYQSLTVQFFLQRRFEHVVLACRIYRVLFGAADQTIILDKGSAASKSLSQGSGQSPTISTLDAMANEAIRDVDEGVKAFRYLVAQKELDSASNRLAESFAIGEYLAGIRTLPLSEKRQVVTFVRDTNQLVGAMEVRDFKTGREIIGRLKEAAADFDATKPLAKMDEAAIAAGLLIDKAKMASLQGKMEDSAADLEKARAIWPTNPALSEIRTVFEKGGLQATSLKDMETLFNQKNYRAILAEQARFSAAVSGMPELEKRLADVLAKVRQLDMAITQSDQLADAGDPLGAWEVMEKAAAEAPADNEINRRRAALAGRAANLSSLISKAQRFEKSGEFGPSLAWYLKARSVYPPSQLAREGIDKLSGQILQGREPLTIPPRETPAVP